VVVEKEKVEVVLVEFETVLAEVVGWLWQL